MRNKHAGICAHCNAYVPAQSGHFQRASVAGNKSVGLPYTGSGWLIRCLECVDRIRAQKQPHHGQASEPAAFESEGDGDATA